MCHDGERRFLLHRRSNSCRDEQGAWDSGAGAIELGETFEEAVAREVREEYLASLQEVIFLSATNVLRDHQGASTHWVALSFAVLVDPREVGIGEPEKIDEIGWFTAGSLPSPRHSQLDVQLDLCRKASVI
ncbi:MAG: NUDIX domain-containing protein [Solirubrobacterales bacterium]